MNGDRRGHSSLSFILILFFVQLVGYALTTTDSSSLPQSQLSLSPSQLSSQQLPSSIESQLSSLVNSELLEDDVLLSSVNSPPSTNPVVSSVISSLEQQASAPKYTPPSSNVPIPKATKIVAPILLVLALMNALFALHVFGCITFDVGVRSIVNCIRRHRKSNYKSRESVDRARKSILRSSIPRIASCFRFNYCLFLTGSCCIVYLSLGTAVFSLMEPSWGIMGAMFFVVATGTSVGFGNPVPTFWYSKLFTMGFIITGGILVAYVIGLLGSIIISSNSDRIARTVTFGYIAPSGTNKLSHMIRLVFAFVAFATTILIGTLVFMFLENWTFLDALYFSIVCASTTGYGDLIPSHRLVCVIFILFGTASLALSIGIISNFVIELYKETSLQATIKPSNDHIEFLMDELQRRDIITKADCLEIITNFKQDKKLTQKPVELDMFGSVATEPIEAPFLRHVDDDQNESTNK